MGADGAGGYLRPPAVNCALPGSGGPRRCPCPCPEQRALVREGRPVGCRIHHGQWQLSGVRGGGRGNFEEVDSQAEQCPGRKTDRDTGPNSGRYAGVHLRGPR